MSKVLQNNTDRSDLYNSYFETPYKGRNENIDHRSTKKLIEFLSSEKLNKSLTKGNNSSSFKCNRNLCNCVQIDNLIKTFTKSPSIGFLMHSPGSLEKYFDSLSRERINVLKLIQKKIEHKNEERNQMDNIVIKESGGKSESNKEKINNSSNFREGLATYNKEIYVNKSDPTNSTEKKYAKNLIKLFEKYKENEPNKLSNFYQEKINLIAVQGNKNEFKGKIHTRGDMVKMKNKTSLKDLLDSPTKLTSNQNSQVQANNYSTPLNIADSSNHTKKLIFCSERKNNLDCNSLKLSSSNFTTLYTSEKKRGKRVRKSSNQLNILKENYKKFSNREWPKDLITEISLKTGLTENKVYKWLWDKKNKEFMKKKRFFIKNGE